MKSHLAILYAIKSRLDEQRRFSTAFEAVTTDQEEGSITPGRAQRRIAALLSYKCGGLGLKSLNQIF